MARTSIFGLLVFYIVYIYYKYVKYRIPTKKKTILFIFIIINIGLFLGFKIFNDRQFLNRIDLLFLRTQSLENGSGRFDVWKNGIEISLNYNPLFGLGRYKALDLNKKLYGNGLPYFHSIYIETFVTYGICGLVLLLTCIKNIISNIKKVILHINI